MSCYVSYRHFAFGNRDQVDALSFDVGELREIEGGCPFWNDDGRFVGVDWLWMMFDD